MNPTLFLELNPKKISKHIITQAAQITHSKIAFLALIDPNTHLFEIEAHVGLKSKKDHDAIKELAKWIFQTRQVFRIHDLQLNPHFINFNSTFSDILALPLEMDGRIIGILGIAGKKNSVRFSQKTESQLHDWSKTSTAWLRTAWQVEHIRNKANQLEALLTMGHTIVSQGDLKNTLNLITHEACRLMQSKLCSLMLLSEDGNELELKAWSGASADYINKPNLSVADSLVGVVARRKKTLTILDVRQNDRYQHTELAQRENLVSLLSVPLVFEKKILGVLSVYTENLHRFSNDEIKLLSLMADLSAVSITKVLWLKKIVTEEEHLKSTERLSALGWLSAEIAHEIRNPLTVIQMLFHSILHSTKMDDATSNDAKIIAAKMKQMNTTVDRVLTFARSSEPVMDFIDVKNMMTDLVLLIRHKMAEQKIQIKSAIEENLPRLRGDRAQIEQAILNLVLNAYQAMPDGGTLTLSARLKTTKTGTWILIAIKDTGEGISKIRQKELFKPFLSHRKRGTGLGLTLVRKTVEQHKGKISLQSHLGKGTTFQIILPIPDVT